MINMDSENIIGFIVLIQTRKKSRELIKRTLFWHLFKIMLSESFNLIPKCNMNQSFSLTAKSNSFVFTKYIFEDLFFCFFFYVLSL